MHENAPLPDKLPVQPDKPAGRHLDDVKAQRKLGLSCCLVSLLVPGLLLFALSVAISRCGAALSTT